MQRMLNPNNTRVLVASRSRNVNPPHGDLVLSVVSICDNSNLNIIGVKFDSSLTFEDHERGIVSRFSQRIGILGLVKEGAFVDTFMFFRCYTMHLFCQSFSIKFSGVGVSC